jgi:hypothetical protein
VWFPLQIVDRHDIVFAGLHNVMGVFATLQPDAGAVGQTRFITRSALVNDLGSRGPITPSIFFKRTWLWNSWISSDRELENLFRSCGIRKFCLSAGRQEAESDWAWHFPQHSILAAIAWIVPQY